MARETTEEMLANRCVELEEEVKRLESGLALAENHFHDLVTKLAQQVFQVEGGVGVDEQRHQEKWTISITVSKLLLSSFDKSTIANHLHQEFTSRLERMLEEKFGITLERRSADE